MNLELSDGQTDLLSDLLMALCLQYEEVIEKTYSASKKIYQKHREKALEIIRLIEKKRIPH